MCNSKIIMYYSFALASIPFAITITPDKFHSITVTVTAKSVYYILKLHITITTSLNANENDVNEF